MKNLSNIGKYLFIVPFAIFGLFHFMNADQMSGMVAPWLPAKVFLVYLTGVALIAAAIGVIINKKAALALQLLGLLLIIFILTIHLPNLIGGDQNAMGMILKDLSMAGGALYMSGQIKG